MENRRYLAVDYGDRRVGIAVSDPTGMIARPLETLKVSSPAEAISGLIELIREYEPAAIVLGRPLSMSGRESELSQKVDEFARALRAAVDIEIIYEDERLSSTQAEQILHAHGKKIKGNKDKIDRMAAAIFLQTFLDRKFGV
ncbi:MAG: Holliday junction resolvase RuvX [Candidatus Zixiibacteriota bacterium]